MKARGLESRLNSAAASESRLLFDLLAKERLSLPSSALFSLVRWLQSSKKADVFLPTTWRITRTLYATRPFPAGGLQREIEWASVVLMPHVKALNAYIRCKTDFEKAFLNAEWRIARGVLDEFDRAWGGSWTVERLRLAAIQNSEGTAAQVAHARRLEAASRSDHFRWFVRFASMRNEEHVSFQGYRRTISELFANSNLDPGERAQVEWHAGLDFPTSEALLAEVLVREATSSTFDYFESLIETMQSVVISERLATYRGASRQALARLGEVRDPRLSSLSIALGIRRVAVTDVTYPVRAFLSKKAKPGTPGAIIAEDVERAVLGAHVPIDAKYIGLKLATNLRPLGTAESAVAVIGQYVLGFEQGRALPAAFMLAHPEYGIWLRVVLPPDLRSDLQRSFPARSLPDHVNYSVAHSAANDFSSGDHLAAAEPSMLVDYVIRAQQTADAEQIQTALEIKKAHLCNGDRQRILGWLCRACTLPSDRDLFLEAASELALSRPALLQSAVPPKRWEDIRPAALGTQSAIRFAVCCLIVLKFGEIDRLRDKLLVAVERVIREAARFVRELDDIETTPLSAEFLSFLQHVAVPANMALVDGIASSRDALVLRSAILRFLMKADFPRAKVYEEELKDISFDLVLDDGMRHVDTSRLYVNLEGLMRWAAENLQEDIERYRALAQVEVTDTLGSDVALEGMPAADLVMHLEKLPRTASDDLLVKALSSAKHAYLSHPSFGLDGFISLRVRHGTLSGTLRSSFDERKLLSLRSGKASDSYIAPAQWLDDMARYGVSALEELAGAFEEFTKTFQISVDELLQRRLRVKSTKHPLGMIDIEVSEITLKGFKYDIASGVEFGALINGILVAYKNSVGHQLGALRSYLRGEFAIKVLLAAEGFQKRCRELAGEHDAVRLVDAMTAAMTGFSASINKVCGWLEVAHKDDLWQLFSLEQIVTIGIDYTKRVRAGFDPKISVELASTEIPLAGRSLVVLVDAIFIMLDNVFAHAGNPNHRRITLVAKMNDGFIDLVITNDLDASVPPDDVRQAFAEATRELSEPRSTSHLDEGRSGFPKLMQLAGQSGKVKLDVLDELVVVQLHVPFSVFQSSGGDAS